MQDVGARRHLQGLHDDVVQAADAGRPVAQLAELCFRQRNQRGKTVHVERRLNHDEHGRHGDDTDRGKVLHRVVGQLGKKKRVDGQLRYIGHEQGVTVGRRPRHGLAGGNPARPGTVLDHKLLAHALAKALAQQARQHIGRAAGGIGHDQFYRTVRIILRSHTAAVQHCNDGEHCHSQRIDEIGTHVCCCYSKVF